MVTTSSSFAMRWRRVVVEIPDRPFLTFEGSDGRVTDFSYRAMDELVAGVAAGLRDHGVVVGSSVHLVQANSVAFVAVWLACARIGAWIVPSDPRAAPQELSEHVSRTRPVVGVTSPARATEYRRAVADAATGTAVVEVDEDDTAVAPLSVDRRPTPPADVDGDTRMAVMFTSGTTAAPKGVELTQANYAFAGDVMAAAAGLTRFDRQFVVLPLFHANAQYYSFAAAISVGASVALMHTFSASGFVEQARRHEVTHASLFAAPIRMVLARTPAGTAPLTLRHAWFAQNLSSEQYRDISTLLGCRPRQIYGMTETVPAVLVNPPVGSRATAIGEPTLGCHLRVVDAELRAVLPNETGAIQVGGVLGATLFRGYLDDPATTEAAIVERGEDGFVWFDTGDRAVVDELGFHYFAGRRSDVLKVAGENVSIVEVEQVLAEHPAVADVAVVGAPDPVHDEVPHAFVVPSPGSADVVASLEAWCDERLAPSKRPRAYHLVAELPRTSVGKIRKFMLRADHGPALDPDQRTTTGGSQP